MSWMSILTVCEGNASGRPERAAGAALLNIIRRAS